MNTFPLIFILTTMCLAAGPLARIPPLYDLLGKWEIQSVYHENVDVTDHYIQDEHRWIEFDNDFTFVSDGEAYGRKEGRFSLEENTGLLSFDLDLGLGKQSHWYVEIDGQRMYWTDTGSSTAGKIKIILIRVY
jgi:hypothetical protein